MNFRRNGSEGENEPALNLTSLIDVLFLLVIFFAVSTTFRVHPGLSVNLPSAQSERVVEDKRTMKAVLTTQGEIFVDQEEVARSDLFKTLREKQSRSRVSLFVLEADEQARHGQVVELMDAARRAGIPRLAIATRSEEDGNKEEEKPKEDQGE
jgi:biopolymer transport protein ExbD